MPNLPSIKTLKEIAHERAGELRKVLADGRKATHMTGFELKPLHDERTLHRRYLGQFAHHEDYGPTAKGGSCMKQYTVTYRTEAGRLRFTFLVTDDDVEAALQEVSPGATMLTARHNDPPLATVTGL